jgi:hypothetical protein
MRAAALAFARAGVLEAVAIGLQVKADLQRGAADIAAKLARGAAGAAGLARSLADRAEGEAQALGADAARDKAAAGRAIAAARALAAALAREVVRKAATVVRAVARVVAKAAVVVGKAAVAVAKVAYKVSGVQSIVSCVTDPGLSSCLQAALTIALVVGTAGSGEIADIAAEGALDAAEDAGATAAEDTAAAAAKDGTPLYRGLSKGHNAFEDAQQGIASPGDVAGHADVYAHNVLDDTWGSRLTSWSTEREVAEGLAGKNGVILRTTLEEMQARGVNILESPDAYDEAEILLEGRIEGLQVTQP